MSYGLYVPEHVVALSGLDTSNNPPLGEAVVVPIRTSPASIFTAAGKVIVPQEVTKNGTNNTAKYSLIGSPNPLGEYQQNLSQESSQPPASICSL